MKKAVHTCQIPPQKQQQQQEHLWTGSRKQCGLILFLF